ncbi:MAG: hypothetical protein M3340_06380 [Actinomycetota bacterium]|nr:hypothetical protein [Actinomycetota bacterium]
MAYGFYVFERYDLMQLASDVDEALEDVPRERIVSISHSAATDDKGILYSAFIVFEMPS